jgi:hypothetical protein
VSELAGAFKTAGKLRRGLEHVRRRAAIRQALLDAAYACASEVGASYAVATKFRNVARSNLSRAGDSPKGIGPQITSRLRGGPATLFDGPEARRWRSRVQSLGQILVECTERSSDADLQKLSEQLRQRHGGAKAFGDHFVQVTDDIVAAGYQRGDAPTAAIFAEQAAVKQREEALQRSTRSKWRVVAAGFTVAAAGVAGHYAVDAPRVPNWADTVAASAVAAVATQRRHGTRAAEEESSGLSAAETLVLERDVRILRSQIERFIELSLGLVEPSLRGPPGERDLSPSVRIEAALTRLEEETTQAREVCVEANDRDRRRLHEAASTLSSEFERAALDEIDLRSAALVDQVKCAVLSLTDPPVKTIEYELDRGADLVELLVALGELDARFSGGVHRQLPHPTSLRVLQADVRGGKEPPGRSSRARSGKRTSSKASSPVRSSAQERG